MYVILSLFYTIHCNVTGVKNTIRNNSVFNLLYKGDHYILVPIIVHVPGLVNLL